MKGYSILMTGLLLCLILPLKAQFTFSFMPEIQGRTIDNLYQVRIGNTGARQRVSLSITVTAVNAGTVAVIRTAAFELMTGVTSVPPAAAYNAAVSFGNSKLATVVKQSGFFPEGDYEYCFRLTEGTSHNGTILEEQCFSYNLMPFSAMQLIQPYEGDKLCDTRPSFSWQPLMPAVNGVQYRMMLVEVKEGQQRAEAIRVNLALINQRQIPMPVLMFPSIANPLVEGKEYAWQVGAYKDGLLLAESEIWDFKVECEKEENPLPAEAFRNLEDLAKGNFYIARGQLMFAFNNAYGETTLNYSIRCLTKPDLQVKKLPKMKVGKGLNQVLIDLTENSSFIDGYYYIMDVKLPDGQEKQLRFIYKQAE
jgi:hypothetical protein